MTSTRHINRLEPLAAVLCGLSFFAGQASFLKLLDYAFIPNFSPLVLSLSMFFFALGFAAQKKWPADLHRLVTALPICFAALVGAYDAGVQFQLPPGSILWLSSLAFGLTSFLTAWVLAHCFDRSRDGLAVYIAEPIGGALGLAIWWFTYHYLGAINFLSALAFLWLIFRIGLTRKLLVPVSALLLGSITFGLLFSFQYGITPIFHKHTFFEMRNRGSSMAIFWSPEAHYEFFDSGHKIIADFDGGNLRTYLFKDEQAKPWGRDVAAPYSLMPHPHRVLIIGGVGGQEIPPALKMGAEHIDVADIAGQLHSFAEDRFAKDLLPFFASEKVHFYPWDGRYALDHLGGKYDLIQIYSVHAGSSTGSTLFATEVTNLFTVESIADDLEHLSDDGVLAVTLPISSRLARLICAGAKMNLTECRSHLIVAQRNLEDDYMVTAYFSKRILSREDHDHLASWLNSDSSDGEIYNIDSDSPRFFPQLDELPATVEHRLPRRAWPYYKVLFTPFTSRQARILDAKIINSPTLLKVAEGTPFGIPIETLCGALPLLFCVLLLPFVFRKQPGGKTQTDLLFLGYGLVFMLLEFICLVYLQALCGLPGAVYVATLLGFLLSSSFAGLLNKKISARNSATLAFCIAGFDLILILFGSSFELPLPWSLPFRFAVCAAAAFLLAAPGSLAFVSLIRASDTTERSFVSAWLAFAVGSILALSIALGVTMLADWYCLAYGTAALLAVLLTTTNLAQRRAVV